MRLSAIRLQPPTAATSAIMTSPSRSTDPARTSRLEMDIHKRLGDFSLDVELEVDGEILVLYGASGAGKTSTLNTVAGLLTPDEGHIRLGDSYLFRRTAAASAAERCNLPARHRGVGFVFQNYALFPHLTAAQNVSYSLWPGDDGRPRAAELLERMSLEHLAARYPHELSGGQQQRVAIARALASRPRILLLDEPFSALDLPLRERFQQDLRQLRDELAFVALYVTHNLDDAFAVGDRLAVLQNGRVLQIGPVDQVFRHPADRHVAEIMGIRNLFRADVVAASADGLRLNWQGLEIEALPQDTGSESTVTVYIHPEEVKIIYPDAPLTDAVSHNLVEGRIASSNTQAGAHTMNVRLTNDQLVEVRYADTAYTGMKLEPGEQVQLSLRRQGLRVLTPPR